MNIQKPRRYKLIGMMVGAFFALQIMSPLYRGGHPEHNTLYWFFIYMPGLLVSFPWSSVTFLIDSQLYSIIIISIGLIVNGVIVGALFGMWNKGS
jgi:uncharacterized membrane protein